MVSLRQLQSQIAKEKAKIKMARERSDLEIKKKQLAQELKDLQRSASQKRNIALVQRTGRGFKRLSKIAGKKLAKQSKLIKEQQLRDDAAALKREVALGKVKARALKKVRGEEGGVIITRTVTGKGKKRRVKVSKRRIKSKRTKSREAPSPMTESVFGELDF